MDLLLIHGYVKSYGHVVKNIVFQSYADLPIFDTLHYIIFKQITLADITIGLIRTVLGELLRHYFLKALILLLAVNIVSLFP